MDALGYAQDFEHEVHVGAQLVADPAGRATALSQQYCTSAAASHSQVCATRVAYMPVDPRLRHRI